MKKSTIKKILITLTTLLMCILLSTSSFAAILGDVDGDGFVKSQDARLALRASVGLESLTDEEKKLADVDCSGDIKAADARSILRAAVGLEELTRTHNFTDWKVEKKATCTENGIQTRTCVCGEKETKKIPGGHVFEIEKATVTKSKVCSRCKTVVEKSFNEYVNPIKTQPHILSFLSSTQNTSKITKDTLKIDRAQLFILLTTMGGYSPKEANAEIDAMEKELKSGMNYNETLNTTFYKNRTLTDHNYPIEGSKLVSELEDSDVASYTVEKVDAVDFREFLDDTYTATNTGYEYETTDYRYLKADNLIKLTVKLKTEKYSEIKDSDIKKTALMKVTGVDIRELADEVLEINSSEDMGDFASAACNEITTNETIIVYIDTETDSPVASCYISSVVCDPTLTMDFMGLIKGSIAFTTDTKSVSLYFFDDYFAK